MCCLGVTYGDTADTGHIFFPSVAPAVTSALELERCWSLVKVYYDPQKIYYKFFVIF